MLFKFQNKHLNIVISYFIDEANATNLDLIKPGFNRKSIKYEKLSNENQETSTNSNSSTNNASIKKRDSKASKLNLEKTNDSVPNLFTKLNELFKFTTTESVSKDIEEIRQEYASGNGNVKRIKSVLKIYVQKATNLIAQDSCGTSDPYVTIQCGNSKVKKTKTIKKTLNPVWNEMLQFGKILKHKLKKKIE